MSRSRRADATRRRGGCRARLARLPHRAGVVVVVHDPASDHQRGANEREPSALAADEDLLGLLLLPDQPPVQRPRRLLAALHGARRDDLVGPRLVHSRSPFTTGTAKSTPR